MLLDLHSLAIQSFANIGRETELPSTDVDTNTGPGGEYTLRYIRPGSAYGNTGVNVC